MNIAGRNRLLACALGASLLAFAGHGSELADAARHGDAAAVRTLLESAAGAELNAPGRDGMTPLLWAAQANDLEIARLLLRRRRRRESRQPLRDHAAVARCHEP